MESGHIHFSMACAGLVSHGYTMLENTINCRLIEATVAAVFGVSPDLLRSQTRSSADVATARQIAMYIAHVGFGLSLTEVGPLFGRDRSTVGYACRAVEDRREDPRFDGLLAAIEVATRACCRAASSRWETLN